MKKQLLLAGLFFTSLSFGQSLDQTNEPAIGQNALMYLCDTLADPYAGTTGSSVTWDYSTILGLSGSTAVMEVLDATLTDSAANFPTSTKALSIQNSFISYFNSTTTERSSQGFVYNEPNFGTVMATFETDEEKLMDYPFSNGNFSTDNFSGSLEFTFNGVPQNPTCTGKVRAEIDGQGTLLLPQATTITNVIRYKIVDTVFTQVVFVIPMDIEFVRTQYEYYDLATSDLPVFVHTNIKIQQPGATTPILEQKLVISAVQPTENVGIQDLTAEQHVLYPNPANDSFTIRGNGIMNVSIVDAQGRTVKTVEQIAQGQSIAIQDLKAGIYMVKVQSNGVVSTQRLIKK